MSEYLETLRELELRIKQGKPVPSVKPTVLPRTDIECIETIFQPRQLRDYTSQPHIDAMAAALKAERTKRLDRIIIYWVGDAWCCIDGHHRLDAYDRANIAFDIPVRVFEGSLDDARCQSYRGNSRDKLPMRKEDKSNGAWRLVATTTSESLSKRTIAEVTSVSERTVASMRETKTRLYEEGVSLIDLASMSWAQARLRAQGITLEQGQFNFDDFVQQQGMKLASRLRRDFGKWLDKNPEVLAYALWQCNESLPRLLPQAWGDYVPDEEDFESDTEGLPDGMVDPVF